MLAPPGFYPKTYGYKQSLVKSALRHANNVTRQICKKDRSWPILKCIRRDNTIEIIKKRVDDRYGPVMIVVVSGQQGPGFDGPWTPDLN